MIDPADMEHCRAAIRAGSLSFHTASRLLPARVRDPALALYAFCRLADDAVDEGHDKTRAVLGLRERLDLVYAGRPRNAAADRAFAAVVQDFGVPFALFVTFVMTGASNAVNAIKGSPIKAVGSSLSTRSIKAMPSPSAFALPAQSYGSSART